MKTLLNATIFTMALTACGDYELTNKNQDAELEAALAPGSKIEFSGYVQRAFEITVEGVTFNDTEDFYTNFVDDLILSDDRYAEALADAEITIEGEYSVEKFGSSSRVFMSSQQGDGHIYESTTNNQAKFTIEVDVSATDEVFKARVINRIGLNVAYEDGTEERFCYILHANRSSISVTETSKPIIFDDFKTQLNSYNCEEAASKIEIPTSGIDIETEEETEELEESEPSVAVKKTTKIDLALAAGTTGDNTLTSIQYDAANKTLVAQRALVTVDGQKQYPITKLTAFDELSHDAITTTSSTSLGKAFTHGGGYLYVRGGKISSFDGTDHTDLVTLDSGVGHTKVWFHNDGTDVWVTYAKFNKGYTLNRCKLDTSANELANCKTSSVNAQSCTIYKSKTHCLTGEGKSELMVFGKKMGAAKSKYAVSKLLMPKKQLDATQLVAFTNGLYLANLVNDQLVLRKLELKD